MMKLNLRGRLKFLSQRKSRALANPGRDWHLLLLALVILIVVSAFAHYILYLSKTAEEVLSTGEVKKLGLKRSELESVVGEFEARAAIHEKLLASPAPVVDPG